MLGFPLRRKPAPEPFHAKHDKRQIARTPFDCPYGCGTQRKLVLVRDRFIFRAYCGQCGGLVRQLDDKQARLHCPKIYEVQA